MSDTRTQVRLRPVIRVFVSSTFSDMKHERNALHADVFPKLEQICERQGFQFQAIDLRWGVSTEAGLDHRTMRICFDELRRAQEISPKPNFLILLGNRYGWRPLPEEISVEAFQTLEQASAQIPGNIDKPAVTVLREWYREDTNAVPPVYLLQSRRQDLGDGQDYTHDAVWNQVQTVLWTIINRAMPPEHLQRRFDGAAADGSPLAIVRFQASATEQEIWHGALRVPDAREHVLAFFREIENLAAFTDPKQIKDFVDVGPSGRVAVALQTEQDRLKAELGQRLGSANVFRNEAPARLVEAQDNQGGPAADVTTDHLPQLCANVVSRLSAIIQGQIDEYWRNTAQASTGRAARELEIEQREYERFAQERGGEESFVGRQVELQAILNYVGSDSHWPLVIHGASGCGKTALLARASQEVAKTRKRIERFIGVAPRSSDLRSLLSSLCHELRQRNSRPDALPTEIKELSDEFFQHLQAATPQQPLILFLDALDQLTDADNGRLLNWLPPGSLPAHVKLVVSCLSDRADGDPAGQPYAELKRRQIPAENFSNLDVLSEAEARLLLFDRWLSKAGRKVSDNQRARIEQRLASSACRQPIFLKLLFEEVQLWHSYDPALVPGESVPALLGQLFDRLCQPTNHGPLLVNRVLGYLSASRHGLAENEVLEILFADPEYRANLNEATEQTRHELPPNAKRIPIALWSRLRYDLAPYLTERAAIGANVLTFYHRQVAEWVQEHFAKLSGPSWQPHQRLANYFDNHSWFLGSANSHRVPNERKCDELLYQRLLAGDIRSVRNLLFSFQLNEAKIAAGLIYDLIDEYSRAYSTLTEDASDKAMMIVLRQAIQRNSAFLRKHISQYPQALLQSCYNDLGHLCCQGDSSFVDGANSPRLKKLLASWQESLHSLYPNSYWLRSRIQPLISPGTHLQTLCQKDDASEHGAKEAGKIVAFSSDGAQLITVSDRVSIRIFETGTGKEVFHVEAARAAYVPHALTISADAKRIAGVCRDETLRMWRTNTGDEVFCVNTPKSSINHSTSIMHLSFSPDGSVIAGGALDGAIRIIGTRTGKELRCLRGNSKPIQCVAFSSSGSLLVTGSTDDTIRLWDATKKGRQLRCFRFRRDHSNRQVCFFPGDDSVIVAATFNFCDLLDSQTGRRISRLAERKGIASANLAISDSGTCMVRRTHGGFEVFDLRRAKSAFSFSSPFLSGDAIAISPDGRFVATGIFDGIGIWDLNLDAPCQARTYERYQSGIEDITVLGTSGTDLKIVSVSTDGSLCIWTYKQPFMKLIRKFTHQTDSEGLKFATFSPDGRLFAVINSAMRYTVNTVSLYDANENSLYAQVTEYSDGCHSDVLSGTFFERFPSVWELPEGARINMQDLRRVHRCPDAVMAGRFTSISRDGVAHATVRTDYLAVRDLKCRKQGEQNAAQQQRTYLPSFSEDGELAIQEVTSGHVIAYYPTGLSRVQALCIPDTWTASSRGGLEVLSLEDSSAELWCEAEEE